MYLMGLKKGGGVLWSTYTRHLIKRVWWPIRNIPITSTFTKICHFTDNKGDASEKGLDF